MDLRNQENVSGFRVAACEFCSLLEHDPTDANRWAEQILAALAHLYALAHRLPDAELPDEPINMPEDFDVSCDERQAVHERVRRALGEQSTYWAYFDPSEPTVSSHGPIMGDLADDLTDIYIDVKPGVRAWESAGDKYLPTIVFDWKQPLFGSHWGVHAVSVMRAMHPIVFLRGITGKE